MIFVRQFNWFIEGIVLNSSNGNKCYDIMDYRFVSLLLLLSLFPF